jgi:hypothetical protein
VADELMRELIAAQEEWAAAEAIPAGQDGGLLASARERRERAVCAALSSGIGPRVIAGATGLAVDEVEALRTIGA